MEGVGNTIKYHRSLAGLTQEELSRDIISFSYLSKIENGSEKPSEEVLELLKKRLNLTDEDFISPQSLIQDLKEWNQFITLNQQEDSRDRYMDYCQKQDLRHVEVKQYYRLFKLHYYLNYGEIRDADEAYKAIETPINSKDLLFYYHLILGIYFYKREDLNLAYDHLQKSENFINLKNFPPYDIAHLQYRMGLCSGRLRKVQTSIYYIEASLEYYKKNYNLDRLIECHMLLGINYGRAKIYKDAEIHYNSAYNIAYALENNLKVSQIKHNEAVLDVIRENSYEAIEKFQISYLAKKELGEPKSLLSTIYCLVIEHFKLNNFEECINRIEEGFEVFNRIYGNELQSQNYYYHFKSIQTFIKDKASFEDFILNKSIPYFEKNCQMEYVARYSYLLGRYYEEENKYKKANNCFKNCINILRSNEFYGGIIL